MSDKTRATRRRRLLGAALVGVSLVGLSTGSAAQLTMGSTAVGSGTAAVADCQAGVPIRVELTSGWVAGQGFRTTGVVLRDIRNACQGKQFGVTLVNQAGVALTGATGVVPAGSATAPVSASTAQVVVSASVDHAEIVIYA